MMNYEINLSVADCFFWSIGLFNTHPELSGLKAQPLVSSLSAANTLAKVTKPIKDKLATATKLWNTIVIKYLTNLYRCNLKF